MVKIEPQTTREIIMDIQIRTATREDAPLILEMIIELAVYEKARHEVKASVTDIESSLFAPDSKTEALLCYVDGKPAGYAVFLPVIQHG